MSALLAAALRARHELEEADAARRLKNRFKRIGKLLKPAIVFLVVSVISAVILVAVESPSELELMAAQKAEHDNAHFERSSKFELVSMVMAEVAQTIDCIEANYVGCDVNATDLRSKLDGAHSAMRLFDMQMTNMIERHIEVQTEANWSYIGALCT